jgi:hypothetical protein
MKTTMLFRPIANPRRTTLAHLKDATELGVAVAADTEAGTAAEQPLPQQTANPRRTVLNTLPAEPFAELPGA